MLSSLVPGEVLFLDEIHRMARPAEEMLYVAMEDFRVDIIVGKGPGPPRSRWTWRPFTLVGATTRAGMLPSPLRDRFGFTAHMDFYADSDLETILRRSARLLGVSLDPAGARRSPGAHGARRAWPTGCCGASATTRRCTAPVDRPGDRARGAGHLRGRRARADRLDRAVLDALLRTFRGGPVGLATLAVSVGEEAETVETVAEPFLVRAGLLYRTPRGRVATEAAWQHLGLTPPPEAPGAGAGAARSRSWAWTPDACPRLGLTGAEDAAMSDSRRLESAHSCRKGPSMTLIDLTNVRDLAVIDPAGPAHPMLRAAAGCMRRRVPRRPAGVHRRTPRSAHVANGPSHYRPWRVLVPFLAGHRSRCWRGPSGPG